MSTETSLRGLPSVERVLAALRDNGTGDGPLAVDAVRAVLSEARAAARQGGTVPPFDDLVAQAAAALAAARKASLRPVINATGVLLQTNLGRAPLSERALAAVEAVSRGYSNLEFDLETGERGSRHDHVRDLIRRTTGAEDGLVVNNNAAGLLMALQVLAAGREVIISRGQAVEIGGGFRIPDVLRQSGARLVEVGTTNRTYTRDYEAAITPDTAAILRVHTSNFRVIGFTAEAPLAELSGLAKERGVLLLDDLGSGCLVDTAKYGLAHEPTVRESLDAGADLALFSGDKLLGGPQCGVIAGRSGTVGLLRRHPLARALRVDRMTIAALNATLMSYAEGREAEEIPIWRMLSQPLAVLKRRARRWAAVAGEQGAVLRSSSMVGGGSLPGEGVPTWCAAIVPREDDASALAKALRVGTPPVVGRVDEGRLLLDPRSVEPGEDRRVTNALRAAIADEFGPGLH